MAKSQYLIVQSSTVASELHMWETGPLPHALV